MREKKIFKIFDDFFEYLFIIFFRKMNVNFNFLHFEFLFYYENIKTNLFMCYMVNLKIRNERNIADL